MGDTDDTPSSACHCFCNGCPRILRWIQVGKWMVYMVSLLLLLIWAYCVYHFIPSIVVILTNYCQISPFALKTNTSHSSHRYQNYPRVATCVDLAPTITLVITLGEFLQTFPQQKLNILFDSHSLIAVQLCFLLSKPLPHTDIDIAILSQIVLTWLLR